MKVNKIKIHIMRHKEVYVGGVIIAGITVVIMRESHAGLIDRIQRGLQDHRDHGFLDGKVHLDGHIDSGKAHLDEHTVFSFIGNNSNNNSIVNVLEREGRGHPGYLIRCKENGIGYLSQKLAADDLNLGYTQLSDHLNGRRDNVRGYHFERIGIAAYA